MGFSRGSSWSWSSNWNWSSSWDWPWCGWSSWLRLSWRFWSGCGWGKSNWSLDCSNVGDIQGLEVKLDSSSWDSLDRWSWGGSSRSSSGASWSSLVLEIKSNASLDILLKTGLEGSRVLVGSRSIVKLDSRSVQCKPIKLSIKVKGSRLNWSSWLWSRSGSGSHSVGCWSPLWNNCSVGSKVGKLVGGWGLRLSWLLGWSSLDWSSGSGSNWDLFFSQLFRNSLSESLLWINWVINANVTIKTLEIVLTFFLISSARQARCVSVLSLNSLWINVTILSTGDAVNSTGLLSEGTISSNITKCKASIIILVTISLKGCNGVFSWSIWSSSVFRSLTSLGSGSSVNTINIASVSGSDGSSLSLLCSQWPLGWNLFNLKHLRLWWTSWLVLSLGSGNQSLQGSISRTLWSGWGNGRFC